MWEQACQYAKQGQDAPTLSYVAWASCPCLRTGKLEKPPHLLNRILSHPRRSKDARCDRCRREDWVKALLQQRSSLAQSSLLTLCQKSVDRTKLTPFCRISATARSTSPGCRFTPRHPSRMI